MVVALGLASRRYGAWLPNFLAEYAGDSLWALMVFVGIGFLAPRWSGFRVFVAALLFSYAIEFSQLYHAPWLDSLRHNQIGGLILGFGFLWSDLACYSIGAAFGLLIEMLIEKVMVKATPESGGFVGSGLNGSKEKRGFVVSLVTEEAIISEVLAKHIGSYFSVDAENKVRDLYGEEVATRAKAIYNDALNCPVDWRSATMDSALLVLAQYLNTKYPWLTPEAKTSLNYCFIMTWK